VSGAPFHEFSTSLVWRLDKVLPRQDCVRHYPSFFDFVHCGADTGLVNIASSVAASPSALLRSCRKAVERLRPLYETSLPPFSLEPFLDHFGVAEVRERLLDRDARLITEGGRVVVEVNLLFPKVHRRFSIAHEIAHMIVNECAGRARLFISHGDAEEEQLCDLLAGELLVPPWALRTHIERYPELLAGEKSAHLAGVLHAARAFAVCADVVSSRVFQDSVFAGCCARREEFLLPPGLSPFSDRLA
jgi:IrrE N-terminal-like domain